MCGIAALYHYRDAAPVDRAALLRIRDHMTPRGPDGDGLWISAERHVGLAHRRLRIIDLSEKAAQPMYGVAKTHVITFNGEIYNYRALRAQLEKKGHSFRSESDTEVLLALYAEKGAAMVDDLRGMYAFALWDGERQGLFLARDPYGIKPLYYADDGTRFSAASQVKALLAGGGLDTRPEPAGHVGFFLWGHVPEPFTLYRGIRALPAGCTLWVDAQGLHDVTPFADVTQALAEAEAETSCLDEREVSEQLRKILLDSVRHHLVADVEVGLFLSSGLDSATLAALLADLGGRLRTITLGFAAYRGTDDDETPLAEALAAHYGAVHETLWVSREDFGQERERLFAGMDQPTIDGVNTYFVSRAAAQAGLKVALSGLGGDELFGGYPSFTEIPRLVGLLQHVPAAATVGKGFRTVSAPVLKRMTSPKYASLIEYGGDYGGGYLLRRGLFMPWELPGLLDADLVREGWAALQTRARLEETVAGIQTPRLKVSALESSWYMRNQLLRDTDWAGMAHSLEVRVPLVDWTLLRAITPLIASKPDLSKQDMARTPATPLPAAVLNRAKTGFQVPIRQWFVADKADLHEERGLRGWARHVYAAFGGAA